MIMDKSHTSVSGSDTSIIFDLTALVAGETRSCDVVAKVAIAA